jgi:SpoVK/Ycf46/Vps4 family AAA+-type ATPase
LIADSKGDEALGVLEEALNLNPNDATALRMYARLCFERNSFEEVRDRLEEAAKNGPEDPESDMLLSRAYLQLGERARSEEFYHKAVKADPNLEDASFLDMIRSGKGEKVPATGKTTWKLVEETQFESERTDITFSDVGGMDELKEYLRMNIILPLKKPDMFRTYGKRVGGGILMYGPPGCGKTYIARALAGECNARFYAVGIHDILDMWLGNSEKNMHALFKQARENAPSIVFLDEIDALGQKRGNPSLASLRGVTNTLLAEMDNVGRAERPILVVGATNTPWSVDTALRRPGRFDRVVFVPPPDQRAREEILKVHLRGKPTGDIDVEKVASKLERYSGADIRALVDLAVEQAIKLAMRTGKTELVTGDMLLNAAKGMRPSTSEWLATASDYVRFSNESGIYDQVEIYLKKDR